MVGRMIKILVISILFLASMSICEEDQQAHAGCYIEARCECVYNKSDYNFSPGNQIIWGKTECDKFLGISLDKNCECKLNVHQRKHLAHDLCWNAYKNQCYEKETTLYSESGAKYEVIFDYMIVRDSENKICKCFARENGDRSSCYWDEPCY